MLEIEVDASGARRLRRLASRMPKHIFEAVKAVAFEGERDVKMAITAVGAVDTGRGRASVRAFLMERDLMARVGPTVYYMQYVDEGTRYITPRRFTQIAADSLRRKTPRIVSTVLARRLREV